MADPISSYCDYVRRDDANPLHRAYHDTEYGYPSRDESVLFERLILEINQAGLSWETILKKREGFTAAYDAFEVEKIALYSEDDYERLMADARIIRNRLKIRAAIHNAQVVLRLREEHGSFANWLDAHHPLTKAEWVKLFGKTFRFTGGEIVNEFLMSLGYLPGAHVESCAHYARAKELGAPWTRVS